MSEQLFKTYETVSGDTWDMISMKVYGTEKYIDYLKEANLEFIRVVFFGSGILLKCPEIEVEVEEDLPPWITE